MQFVLASASSWVDRVAFAPNPIPSIAACNKHQCSVQLIQDNDSPEELQLLLKQLENLRDWVSQDVASAAMQAAREKRSLDNFISELQVEVTALGDEISLDFELTGLSLEEQAEAFARDRRQELAERAEALIEELEASAPVTFKHLRDGDQIPPQKSPFLPLGARVVVAGGSGSFRQALMDELTNAGLSVEKGTDRCAAPFADPTLPASFELRRELEGAEALVLCCEGAVRGGVSPTFLMCVSRVLPKTLRRVLVIAPRGCDRTFELEFALPNLLGALDKQRAGEQAVALSAEALGAVWSVIRVAVDETQPASEQAGGEQQRSDRGAPSRRARGAQRSLACGQIGYGDVFSGSVAADVVCAFTREALRRAEAENCRFSVGSGGRGDFDDEFLKLIGPEIARFETARPVPVDWVRDWARALPPGGPSDGSVLSSRFKLIELPTAQQLAAAGSIWEVERLPHGIRIRFLASGVEFVGDNEEDRVKGDFDGAIDLLVESHRVRVVRSEMEPVYRRLTNGGRKQVAPLVKITSERNLLRRLSTDLKDEGFL